MAWSASAARLAKPPNQLHTETMLAATILRGGPESDGRITIPPLAGPGDQSSREACGDAMVDLRALREELSLDRGSRHRLRGVDLGKTVLSDDRAGDAPV